MTLIEKVRRTPSAAAVPAPSPAAPPVPARSEARQALAVAIVARADAERVAAEAHAAAKRCGDELADARSALRSARSRVIEMRASGVALRSEITEAVAAVETMAGDVEALRLGHQAWLDRTEQPDRDLKRATTVADRAARAVLAVAVPPLLAEVADSRERLIAKLAGLAVCEVDLDPHAAADLSRETRAALNAAEHDNFAGIARRSAAADRWRRAFEALAKDADAALPE